MKYKAKHSTLAKIWGRTGENAVFPVTPSIHALTAQLKEAKNGTTEARHLHDKIKVHLHSIGSQLLEGKVEHANMAHAVKRNADAIHSHSKYIGEL